MSVSLTKGTGAGATHGGGALLSSDTLNAYAI